MEASIPGTHGDHGIRCPSVFVWPNLTRLHICTSRNFDYNACFDYDLNVDQWYKLKITQRKEGVLKWPK